MNKKFKMGLRKHAPTILLVTGCVGLVGAVVSAVFDKEKYDDLIDEALEKKAEEIKEEQKSNEDEDAEEPSEPAEEIEPELKKSEKLKIMGKAFWKTAVIGIFAITCLVASNRLIVGQLGTMTAAYVGTKGEYNKFVEKAKEKLGPKKSEELEAELMAEKMKKNTPTEASVIVTGGGDTLFYDSWNDRYFFSDMQTVRKGLNDANVELMNATYLTGNEFWEFVNPNLAPTGNGEIYGWDSGLSGFKNIEIKIYAVEVTSGQYAGKPALGIKFEAGSEPQCQVGYHM